MNLKQMIADRAMLRAAVMEAYGVRDRAEKALDAGSKALLDAMVEASGRKIGDVIKTADGTEGRIRHFRLSDDTLIAIVDGKTKSTGAWSSRVGFTVRLNVKIEEEANG